MTKVYVIFTFLVGLILGIYLTYRVILASIQQEGIFQFKDIICASIIEEDME